jgi:hypothetical protein
MPHHVELSMILNRPRALGVECQARPRKSVRDSVERRTHLTLRQIHQHRFSHQKVWAWALNFGVSPSPADIDQVVIFIELDCNDEENACAESPTEPGCDEVLAARRARRCAW